MVFKKLNFVLLFILFLAGCAGKQRRPDKNVFYNHLGSVSGKNYSEKTDEPVQLPIKAIKKTNLDEALLCADYYAKVDNKYLANEYAIQALSVAKDIKLRARLLLQIADLYMAQEYFDKAKNYYKEFRILYPGSDNVPYAFYNEIKCDSLTQVDSARDQTKTYETIKLAEKFLEKYPKNEFAADVKAIYRHSSLRALAGVLNIVKFYLNKYSYQYKISNLIAAHGRIKDMVKYEIPRLDDAKELLKLSELKVVKPVEKYVTTLQDAVDKVENYLKDAPGKIGKKSNWSFLRQGL